MDGSSETNPYIDSSVGALVWVRRRNGSWWPGRILGPEELPGSHLLSPRTGTPVKLLGREDGSVDWYNIEKSRRVKAFRCGDFDECIERAKSLASVLTKKREKYARREDAILHALELEKKHIQQNYILERSLSLDQNYKEMSNFADDDMVLDDDVDGMANHSDFQSDFMDPESSADATQASLDSLFSLQGDKKFLDADWEDDIADTLPRMRGLQDFGLRIASTKDRKASWSAAYEQTPHVSFTEDEQKMASCITKSTATCPAPISTNTSCTVSAVSKRKRSAQAGYTEDESAYKKRDRRKPLNRVLESSVKFADGATDVGSKAPVPCFVPATGRNGSALLQPKQENRAVMLGNVFQGPSDLKPLTTGCGTEFWPAPQIDSRARHELLDSSAIMDKACSSFSDHVKSNCCDGRPFLYAGSQMEVAPLSGSTFVDSCFQGVPGSRSSFFPRSAYTGPVAGVNDNGFQKGSSLSLPENVCGPLSSFHMWPYYGPREVLYEKFGNELGLRGQVASSKAVGFPDYSFESTIPSTVLPIYSLYNNPLEDNSTFGKSGADDREGSLLLPKSMPKADISKAPIKSPKQCLSAVAEGDGGRRTIGEDEADSFQPIPDSSVCSLKGVGARDANGSLKPKRTVDEGLWNERLDDDTDIHGYVHKRRSTNECNGFALGELFSKWQAKGRRGLRVRCRNSWRSPAAGATLASIVPTMAAGDELEEMQEEAGTVPGDFKAMNRVTRGLRYSFNFDSSSEDEESLGETGKSRQPAYRAHVGDRNSFEGGNGRPLDVVGVHESIWVEVPVKDDTRVASYNEHVPLVSLMSLLNGKPIVGYSVLVEIIEKRYDGNQGGASWSHFSGSVIKKPPVQPMWRTGRRTAMLRIPRACGILVSRDVEPERQQQHMHSSLQNRVMRKSGFLMCPAADKKKFLKKPGLLPQKTRMLSSIAVPRSDESMEHAASRVVTPPLVTCIPVNVIFNRIREVLYRGINHDSDVF
eukprot:c15358_g1_i3 orf=646-3597(+)